MTRTRICIIGCGFAGLSAARFLSRGRQKEDWRVTVFDRSPAFNFLPLLPDCIGRAIDPRFLAVPIERLSLRLGFDFINEEVISLDLDRREIKTASQSFGYEYVLVAGGTETNFYGNDAVRGRSFKVDSVKDIRTLLAALSAGRHSSYIVAGGGYTGVEIATNLKRYLTARGRNGRVVIAEKAPSLLGPLPEWMKAYTLKNLSGLGVEIRTGSVVERVGGEAVSLSNGEVFSDALLVWTAGVKTPDFVQGLNLTKSPQGRLQVDGYLGAGPQCFAAGDSAYFLRHNAPLRMAVQFAITQGAHAALNIERSIRGKRLAEYRPLDLGYIIPMANNASCGKVLGVNVTGPVATLFHFIMCVYRTVGLRNKAGIVKNLLTGGAA